MLNCILELLLLPVLLAGCASPIAGAELSSTPTPITLQGDEALRRDAETLAKSLGISTDEALRRVQYQDAIGKLGAELETQEVEN